jgi:hypothetical protein
VVPVTAGINVCVVPKSSEADRGVTLTLTEVGAGTDSDAGTAGELVTVLLQPRAHAVLTSRASVSIAGRCLRGALREQAQAS